MTPNISKECRVIGSSLGGAAALLAHPPLRVDALILESVYPTIEIATKNRLQNYLGPIGRWSALLFLKQLHYGWACLRTNSGRSITSRMLVAQFS